MHIGEQIRGDVAVVALSGGLHDEEDGIVLEQKIISLTADNIRKIVFDLGKLNSVNSQGLSALLRAVKSVRTRGGDIRLAGLDEHLENIFAKTRLVRIFDTYETVDRAAASYIH